MWALSCLPPSSLLSLSPPWVSQYTLLFPIPIVSLSSLRLLLMPIVRYHGKDLRDLLDAAGIPGTNADCETRRIDCLLLRAQHSLVEAQQWWEEYDREEFEALMMAEWSDAYDELQKHDVRFRCFCRRLVHGEDDLPKLQELLQTLQGTVQLVYTILTYGAPATAAMLDVITTAADVHEALARTNFFHYSVLPYLPLPMWSIRFRRRAVFRVGKTWSGYRLLLAFVARELLVNSCDGNYASPDRRFANRIVRVLKDLVGNSTEARRHLICFHPHRVVRRPSKTTVCNLANAHWESLGFHLGPRRARALLARKSGRVKG